MVRSTTEQVMLNHIGTNHGTIVGPGGPSSVLQMVRGTSRSCYEWFGGQLWGTSCSMTAPKYCIVTSFWI